MKIIASLVLALCLVAAPASAIKFDIAPTPNFTFTIGVAEPPWVFAVGSLEIAGDHCSRFERVTAPIEGFPNPLALSKLFVSCRPDGEE